MIVDVELGYYKAEDPDEGGTWHAEWAVRGSTEGTEDAGEDIRAIVAHVVDDLRRDYGVDVKLEWQVGAFGELAPDDAARLIAKAEVRLPESTAKGATRDLTR